MTNIRGSGHIQKFDGVGLDGKYIGPAEPFRVFNFKTAPKFLAYYKWDAVTEYDNEKSKILPKAIKILAAELMIIQDRLKIAKAQLRLAKEDFKISGEDEAEVAKADKKLKALEKKQENTFNELRKKYCEWFKGTYVKKHPTYSKEHDRDLNDVYKWFEFNSYELATGIKK